MRKVIITSQATSDLAHIRHHINKDNPDAATKLISQLHTLFEKLALFPQLGHAQPELEIDTLRSLSISSYVIFYIPQENHVEIIRILHEARNFEEVFGG